MLSIEGPYVVRLRPPLQVFQQAVTLSLLEMLINFCTTNSGQAPANSYHLVHNLTQLLRLAHDSWPLPMGMAIKVRVEN